MKRRANMVSNEIKCWASQAHPNLLNYSLIPGSMQESQSCEVGVSGDIHRNGYISQVWFRMVSGE